MCELLQKTKLGTPGGVPSFGGDWLPTLALFELFFTLPQGKSRSAIGWPLRPKPVAARSNRVSDRAGIAVVTRFFSPVHRATLSASPSRATFSSSVSDAGSIFCFSIGLPSRLQLPASYWKGASRHNPRVTTFGQSDKNLAGSVYPVSFLRQYDMNSEGVTQEKLDGKIADRAERVTDEEYERR